MMMTAFWDVPPCSLVSEAHTAFTYYFPENCHIHYLDVQQFFSALYVPLKAWMCERNILYGGVNNDAACSLHLPSLQFRDMHSLIMQNTTVTS
jgi:hypothetical protein